MEVKLEYNTTQKTDKLKLLNITCTCRRRLFEVVHLFLFCCHKLLRKSLIFSFLNSYPCTYTCNLLWMAYGSVCEY